MLPLRRSPPRPRVSGRIGADAYPTNGITSNGRDPAEQPRENKCSGGADVPVRGHEHDGKFRRGAEKRGRRPGTDHGSGIADTVGGSSTNGWRGPATGRGGRRRSNRTHDSEWETISGVDPPRRTHLRAIRGEPGRHGYSAADVGRIGCTVAASPTNPKATNGAREFLHKR